MRGLSMCPDTKGLAIFILLTTTTIALCQSTRERERVALAYEQAGDWRNAARLWQELYQEQPTNSLYLVGSLRSLKMLQSYEAIIELYQKSPEKARTWEASALFGYALYRNGKRPEALSVWEQTLQQITPPTEQSYRAFASLQLEAGSNDQAARTYQYARRTLSNPAAFAEEICQLAIVARDIQTALNEVFTFLAATQNLSRTQGYLATILSLGNTETLVRDRLVQYLQTTGKSPLALRLYEWFLREVGNYKEALEVVVQLETLTGKSGRELYAFAERARNEAAYDVALEAFNRLLSLATAQDIRTMALYGYVRTLEQKTLTTSSYSTNHVRQVIAEYERIVREFPNQIIAADAMLRIAELVRDYLSDPLEALERYNSITHSFPNSEQAARARLERLPLIVRLVGLDSAASLLESEQTSITRFASLRDQVVYQRGEFEFFRCRFHQAMELYRLIAQNTDSPLANDAIERLTLLSICRSDSISLCKWAHAELAFYQRDWQTGFRDADSLTQTESDVSEYALATAGARALRIGMFSKAKVYFSQLLQTFPETIYADRALWGIGLIEEQEGNPKEALSLYTQLLTRFPNSIYVPSARSRIRSLRGDM
ncbi:MAG: tetratricopeptide repeat protein [Bacteroidota bacterium]|nr:tetratricopeptide repeat protein [Bacteroidota bacterium]